MNRSAFLARTAAALALAAGAACNAASTGEAVIPNSSNAALVRYVLGSPNLKMKFEGIVIPLGITYLQVNGATFASSFPYGAVTQYGTLLTTNPNSLTIYDSNGYFVGPLALPQLQGGKRYSLVVVGSYPNYRVIAFAEPQPTGGARMVAYNASSTYPKADLGTFGAASGSGYVRRGSVAFGATTAVTLGAHVSNLGAYVGKGTKPFPASSSTTLAQLDGFDAASALPFENATTLTIFVLDPSADGTIGPLVGLLDP